LKLVSYRTKMVFVKQIWFL